MANTIKSSKSAFRKKSNTVMHGLLASMLFAGTAAQAATIYTDGDKSFSFGMGITTSATNGSGDKLSLDDMRIYTSGKIAKGYGFTFNMVKDANDTMHLMDAIAQIEVAPEFNFWTGQFLSAFDRQGLNGPYFSVASPKVYAAGLQANYPAKFAGRDVGAAIWGDVGNFKYQVGAFNGVPKSTVATPTSNLDGDKLYSVRLSYALLDAEPGYYTSGTYFGSKNIATVGIYYQTQKNGYGTAAAPSNYTGMGADFLYEKKLDGGGAATLEAGYTKVDFGNVVATTAYASYYQSPFQGTSWFIQPSWYSGFKMGPGAMQPYVRYTKNSPDAGFTPVSSQTDIGLSYIIKGYDTRVFLNYSKPADQTDVTTLALQMQF